MKREYMVNENIFSAKVLDIDWGKESNHITDKIRQLMSGEFRKQGLVVAMSGGIDSSVVAELCVKALGKDRVLGLLMPEKDSSGDTLELSRLIADHLCI